MLKKYNDFILEKFSSSHFDSYYNEFIDIYKNQIVPKIGEVEVFTNFMLNGILDKTKESRFHNLRKNLIDARNEFSDSIKNLTKFYNKLFSNLAPSNGDPEDDFKEMQTLMNRNGFTLDIIKKLFDPIVCVFLSQSFTSFIQQYSLDEENGYIDIYLYKLNENLNLKTTVWLGGENWGSNINENSVVGSEEVVIKYAYGYHKTKYGKLFLEQQGFTKGLFVIAAYQHLKDYLQENVFDSINSDLDFNFDANDYLTLDDDKFIIYYLDMFNYYKKSNKSTKIDEEWFKDKILYYMRIMYRLDIQDTGEELIFNDYEEN